MAKADGRILIDTEIEDTGFEKGSKEIEASLKRMAASINGLGQKAKISISKQINSFQKLNSVYREQEAKIESLKQKQRELENVKAPTKEYIEVGKQVEKLSASLDKAIEKQIRFVETGGNTKSTAFQRMEYDIENLRNRLNEAQAAKTRLETSGKAYSFGDTKGAAANSAKLEAAEKKLALTGRQLESSYASVRERIREYDAETKKADKTTRRAAKGQNNLSKSTKKANVGLKSMLTTSLLFSFVFQGISAVINGIKEGMGNLAQYSSETNAVISSFITSLTYLKNSFATAFAPVLSYVIPVLNSLIDAIATAMAWISQFAAVLAGKSTFVRAVKVQEDYAASLKGTGSAAKDAAKDAKGALADFDKLTVADKKDESSGSGGGAGGGPDPSQMFETVETTATPLMERLKETLSNFFEPFKQAWAAEGQSTIEAAQYAFESLRNLAGSVGESLMEVWTNGTGTESLTLILQIAQGILETIGNIASNFEVAWTKAGTGTRIIQGLWDAVNSVLSIVNRIVQLTSAWSLNLDFTPLLESVAALSETLSPLIDSIGNILLWLYETILLPLFSFVLEDALPRLITIVGQVLEAITLVLNFISENVLPILEPILNALLEAAENVVNGVLDTFSGLLSFLLGVFTGDFDRAFEGLELILHGLQEIADGVFGFIQNDILTPIIEFLKGAFKNDWSETFGIIGDVMNGFSTSISEIIDAVQTILEGIITFLSGAFKGDWEQAWEGIKQILKGVWDGIVAVVKAPINTIIGLVNGMISAIESGLNGILGGLNGILDVVPDEVPLVGGLQLPKVNIGKIPYLAQGTVVPPRAGEFLAMLGDNNKETEVVSPLSTIEKAVERAIRAVGNTGYGQGNIEAHIYLDGEELGRSTVKFIRKETRRTGNNPVLI